MLRRDLTLFGKCIAALLAAGGLFACIAVIAVAAASKGESGVFVRPAVYIYNGDSASGLGGLILQAAESHKTVNALIDLTEASSEAEAADAVRRGAAGAIIIPDGFFGKAAYGDTLTARVILPDGTSDGKRLLATYMSVASGLLYAAETAVFAGDILVAEYFPEENAGDFNIYLNMYMLGELMGAGDKYFQYVSVPYTRSSLGLAEHYAACFLAFFSGVSLLAFGRLYRTDFTRSRLSVLKTRGVGRVRFLFGKCLFPFVWLLAVLAAFTAAGAKFLNAEISAAAVLSAAGAMLFTAVFGSLVCVSGAFTGSAAFFLLSMAGLFLSGGIVPYSALPPLLTEIGRFTPLGAAVGMLTPLLGGSFSPVSYAVAAAYVFVSALLVHGAFARALMSKEEL